MHNHKIKIAEHLLRFQVLPYWLLNKLRSLFDLCSNYLHRLLDSVYMMLQYQQITFANRMNYLVFPILLVEMMMIQNLEHSFGCFQF